MGYVLDFVSISVVTKFGSMIVLHGTCIVVDEILVQL
jgi:hypothetical protein